MEKRESIIKAIKTPLGYFTLVLLIIESLLLILIPKVEGGYLNLIIFSIIALLFLVVILVFKLASKGKTVTEFKITSDKEMSDYKYDVFLSAPMAALNKKEYDEHRASALKIIEWLKGDNRIKTIYFAGDNIKDSENFTPHDIAVKEDLEAIKNSKYFILFYPKRVASSVIFEAGSALALGKNCIYFVKDRKHLPFLMKQAEQAFTNIRLYEYKEINDIQKTLQNKNLLKFS